MEKSELNTREKIRVVQLVSSLAMGGAERLVTEYALRLDKSRFEVMVVCLSKADSPYYRMVEEAGVPITYVCDRIPTWGRRDLFSRAVNHCSLYFTLGQCLRSLSPEVLHIHLPLNKYVRFAHLQRKVRIFYFIGKFSYGELLN